MHSVSFRDGDETYISEEEYVKFLHYVNDVYYTKYAGKKFGQIFIDNIYYRFEIVEFNEYNIVYRKELS